jgi:hypothetical protein
MNSIKDEMYIVDNYTDVELFDILDLINPSDRELEAKINLMINKHDIDNEQNKPLYIFFNDIYNHFFELPENDEDDYNDILFSPHKYETNYKIDEHNIIEYDIEDNIVESFDTNTGQINQSKQSNQSNKTGPLSLSDQIQQLQQQIKELQQQSQKQLQKQLDQIKQQEIIRDASLNAVVPEKPVSLVNAVSYTKDYMNPLLKQTYKRIISIDSQYRNKSVYPFSTDFTFSLSDTLKNVLSLKLYSIQIPYTWYTINSNFGGNFFYLKANTDGINNGYHDYQISIPTGNYSVLGPNGTGIIETINNSIANLNTTYADVNFGTTNLSYVQSSCISTLNIDITKIYNESVYEIKFGDKIYFDASGYNDNYKNPNTNSFSNLTQRNYDASNNFHDISSFLGFDKTLVNTNYILSNLLSSTIDLNNPKYKLDNLNNSFKIIQYHNNDEYVLINDYNYYQDNTISIIENSFNITLSLAINTMTSNYYYSINEIMNDLNTQLLNNNYLINSKMEIYPFASFDNINLKDISNNVFKLIIQFNRNTTPNNINSKYIVQFPSSTNDTTIWTGTNSLFNFQSTETEPNNMNNNSMNNVVGTNSIIETNYSITDKPNLIFTCTKPKYDNSYNNYTIDISNTQNNFKYSLSQYLQNINDTVQKNNNYNQKTTDASMNFSKTVIKSNNNYEYTINILKTFDQNIYYLDLSNNKPPNTTTIKDPSGTILYDLGLLSIKQGSNSVKDISNIDLSTNAIVFEFNRSNNYYVNTNKPLFFIRPQKSGAGNSNVDISVNLIPSDKMTSYTDNNNNTGYYSEFTDLSQDINNSLQNFSDTSYNFIFINCSNTTEIDNNTNIIKFTITFNIKNNLYITDYNLIFNSYYKDVSNNSTPTLNNSWMYNFGFDYSYNLGNNYKIENVNNIYNPSNYPQYNITGKRVNQYFFLLDDKNGSFAIQPRVDLFGGAYTGNDENSLVIKICSLDDNNNILDAYDENQNNQLSQYDIITQINNQINLNNIFKGSTISTITNNSLNYNQFSFNINKLFSAQDYRVVFYDPFSFVKCNVGDSSIQNVTWDQTMGWILGFRNYLEYYLNDTTQNYISTPSSINNINIISIIGDTTIAINLYNYFLIQLNDYSQSHINDGLVTVAKPEQYTALPSYVNKFTIQCDTTGSQVFNGDPAPSQTNSNFNNLTQTQIYSANQILNARKSQINTYSKGPYTQDVFAIIPIKPGNPGQTYIEFGGSLQNQDRTYFGPVNLSKFSVQLLTDRGNLLDLNNSDWGFSLVCEQLYSQTIS